MAGVLSFCGSRINTLFDDLQAESQLKDGQRRCWKTKHRLVRIRVEHPMVV